MDTTLLLTIVPPIFAGIIAYAIARRKAEIQEAKIAAEAQNRAMETALQLVSKESKAMREELRQELEALKNENKELKEEIGSLRTKLYASDELIGALRAEITTLRTTLQLYEKQIQLKEDNS